MAGRLTTLHSERILAAVTGQTNKVLEKRQTAVSTGHDDEMDFF